MNGTLIDDKSSAATKVIDHPQLGELTISGSKIKSLSDDDETTTAAPTDPTDNPEVASSSDDSSLSGSINFGFDGDLEHKSYYKSIKIDLSGDLTYKNGLYTNTLSFDWENNEDKYDKGGDLSDIQSLEIDITRDRQIQNRNLTYHFSNTYDYDSFFGEGIQRGNFFAKLSTTPYPRSLTIRIIFLFFLRSLPLFGIY